VTATRRSPSRSSTTTAAAPDSNDTAIFGFRFDPDPDRVLTSVKVTRTDVLGVFDFFGATAVRVDQAALPDLYESTDPAAVVDPGNLVAASIASPYQHQPGAASLLYYQVDDGTGWPPLIHAVASGSGLRFSF
jgi:hypothetical protein